MCIDSCITLNSSYIACGEYVSSTLTGRQASSMAKMPGQQTIFAVFIREHGEELRTNNTPWQSFGRKAYKLYRKTM